MADTLRLRGSTIQGVTGGPRIDFETLGNNIVLRNSGLQNGYIMNVETGRLSMLRSGTTHTIYNLSSDTNRVDSDLILETSGITNALRYMGLRSGFLGGDPTANNIARFQLETQGGGGGTVTNHIQQYYNGVYYTLSLTDGTFPRLNIPVGIDIPVSVYNGFQVYQSTTISSPSVIMYVDSRADLVSYNSADAAMKLGSFTGTSRSLNTSGTINMNGTDYAEYMTKCSTFTVAKGDIIGINNMGQITNKFTESVTFGIKSTKPCLVGGDEWSAGLPPKPIYYPQDISNASMYSTHTGELAIWEANYEALRTTVDRIAFCGQAPVNINTTGVTVGSYIIPTAGPSDTIIGTTISLLLLDLSNYKKAIGRIIKILSPTSALCIVIMH